MDILMKIIDGILQHFLTVLRKMSKGCLLQQLFICKIKRGAYKSIRIHTYITILKKFQHKISNARVFTVI